MGCGQNSGRCFLLTICSLQIASTALRQVFDFLGFMWLPIIANFFNFIFVIFGFFGAYQYKPKYILIYVIWLVAWVSWNVFVSCFYLNVGVLSNRQDWLNFGTGSASWWEVNGPGCRAVYPSNLTSVDPLRPLRPDRVDGCVLDYVYVETLHAAMQCVLALVGVCVSLYLLAVLTEEDDTCKTKMKATSIYSVEYSPNNEDSCDSIDLDSGTLTSQYNTNSTFQHQQLPAQHAATSTMTPRRVKRHHHNRTRSSGRSPRQPSHPMPQTNFANNYSASNNAINGIGNGNVISSSVIGGGSVGSLAGLGGNAANSVAVPSISGNISSRSSHHHNRSSHRSRANRQSGRNRRAPQYVNPVTQLMDDTSTTSSTDSQKIVGMANVGGPGIGGRLGHSNPMYVHSRPGSLHSLAAAPDEPGQERPPSVHSSYSNYHGVRASLATTATHNNNNSNSTAGGLVGAIPQAGGIHFGRAVPNQVGKGLRGSQNSILGSGEQRRTALTTSEIRIPNSNANNNNGNNGLRGSIDSNIQLQSQVVAALPKQQLSPSSAAAAAGQYNSQLSPSSITSVTNISPSSIISSSHNTTNSSCNNSTNTGNIPYHLLPPHQQKLQLQQQQQQKQLLLQQSRQQQQLLQQQQQLLLLQQQQQLHHHQQQHRHQYHHLNHDIGGSSATQASLSHHSHVDRHNPNVPGSHHANNKDSVSHDGAAGNGNISGNANHIPGNSNHIPGNSNHIPGNKHIPGNSNRYRSTSPPYSSPLYSRCPTDEEQPPPYQIQGPLSGPHHHGQPPLA